MIEHGDVRAGLSMILKKRIEVLSKDHAAGSNDDILFFHLLDLLNIASEGLDICIVNFIGHGLIREKDLNLSTLGVNVVMAACPDVLYHGTGHGSDINLDVIDIAVAEIGNREIDHAVSSKEGKCADGTIVLKSCHFLVSG